MLLAGLKFSPLNENLFIKTIKVEEKLGNYQAARQLIKGLDGVPLERSWKMRVEGALFEGRVGNQTEARAQFKELLQQCPTYGPIFFEASRYEEREGNFEESLQICEDGLDKNQKYGPLWFQYLRLYEKLPKEVVEERYDSLQTILNEMFENISRELDWKIYIEASQTYERQGNLD